MIYLITLQHKEIWTDKLVQACNKMISYSTEKMLLLEYVKRNTRVQNKT